MLERVVNPPHLQIVDQEDGQIDGQIDSGRGIVRYGNRTFEMGFQRVHDDDRGRALRTDLGVNLGIIIEGARHVDVELALLTYPAPRRWYGAVSSLVRNAARRTGARLIDVTSALPSACTGRARTCSPTATRQPRATDAWPSTSYTRSRGNTCPRRRASSGARHRVPAGGERRRRALPAIMNICLPHTPCSGWKRR